MFGSLAFLFALPLAGLPIVFHLLMKRRRQSFDFSTFMFFLRSDPNLAGKRRLRERLLLLLRMLFIAFILLALARPRITAFGQARGPVALAIVLDNSASMSARGASGLPKIESAIAAARSLAQSLDAGSKVSLTLLVEDPAADIPRTATFEHDEMLTALGRVRATAASGRPRNALQRAARSIASTDDTALSAAIYVISDLQHTEWESVAAPTVAEPVPTPPVVFLRIPSRASRPPNAVIDSVTLPALHLLPRRTATVAVGVSNRSDVPLDLRMTSEDNLGVVHVSSLRIGPRGRESAAIRIRPETPGVQWLSVALEGDGFVADNRVTVGLVCQPPAAVLFMGDRSEFGLLPAAISPAGDGRHTSLTAHFCSADDVSEQMQALAPRMIVATWSDVLMDAGDDLHSRLRDFVAAGNSLLVVPSVGRESLPLADSGWIGARPIQGPPRREAALLDVLDPYAAVWGALRRTDGRLAIRHFTAQRFWPLVLSAAYRPLLGRTVTDPVLAERSLGDGRVYVSGIAFAPAWSSMANDSTGAGMLLVHNMVLGPPGASSLRRRAVDVVAGEPLTLPLTHRESVRIRSVVGDPLDIALPAGENPVFPRTGVYSVQAAGDETWVWVRPSLAEGRAEFIQSDRLPGWRDISHRIADWSDEHPPVPRFGSTAQASLFLPFLFAAIAAWMAESWMETAGRGRGSSPPGGKPTR